MITPNTYTHQIVLQIKFITQDAELTPIETWQTWRTLWAQPLPKTGREYYKFAVTDSEITEIFKVRYIGGITPHQRILFRCKYYEILSVINVEEKNIELVLTCKAVI